MPLNEIEAHPFLNYFLGDLEGIDDARWANYTKLIVGSFPVYAITKTTFPFEESRFEAPAVEMPFFYGSETNSFWQRLAEVFDTEDPQLQNTPMLRKQLAISLLEENSLLLTDVVKKTNRFKVERGIEQLFSPADSSLLNLAANQEVVVQFELNDSIAEWLIKGVNIRSIYFTAQKAVVGKNPGGWFRRILQNNNIQLQLVEEASNALRYQIFNLAGNLNRIITLFFLPTPSSYRSIAFTPDTQHSMFVNYLNSTNPVLYQTLNNQNFQMALVEELFIKEYRKDFIKVWWSKFLLEEDWAFDGTVIY